MSESSKAKVIMSIAVTRESAIKNLPSIEKGLRDSADAELKRQQGDIKILDVERSRLIYRLEGEEDSILTERNLLEGRDMPDWFERRAPEKFEAIAVFNYLVEK